MRIKIQKYFEKRAGVGLIAVHTRLPARCKLIVYKLLNKLIVKTLQRFPEVVNLYKYAGIWYLSHLHGLFPTNR